MGGCGLAEARVDGRQRRLLDAGEVEHPASVENAKVDARPGTPCQGLEMRQGLHAHAIRVEQARCKWQHRKTNGKPAVDLILDQIALSHESLHEAIGGGPCNACDDSRLRDGRRTLRSRYNFKQIQSFGEALYR